MASTSTGIEWTEATWNPVRGCSRVSPGCGGASGVGGCYAEKIAARFSGPSKPYEGLARWHTDSEGQRHARWTGEVRFVPEALAEPLKWRKPKRVFVNSMSDLFHVSVSNEHIAAIFGVMAACPQHTFQVLTKRADRMHEWFRWLRRMPGMQPRIECACAAIDAVRALGGDTSRVLATPATQNVWPLPNVWLGVSAEDQQRADERIPHLLACPAAVRWVSYEPALGPVRFDRIGSEDGMAWLNALRGTWAVDGRGVTPTGPRLDWIVVGGESGGGARPFDVAWARRVIWECGKAKVAAFVKQLGGAPFHDIEAYHPGHMRFLGDNRTGREQFRGFRLHDRKGGDIGEWPADLRVRQYPGGAL